MGIYYVVGVVLAIYGVVLITRKDIAWKLTEWSNSIRGIKSERTTAWEDMTSLSGCLTIGLGIILFFVALHEGQRQRDRQASVEAMTKEVMKWAQQQGDSHIQTPKQHVGTKNPFKNAQEKNSLALFQTVQKNDINAVKALLNKGADPNYKRPYGHPWRHYTGKKLLWEKTEEMTVLMSACTWGNSQTVELLIDRGADVNARDNIGNTPLILAATWQKVDNVAVLLKHKAQVNIKDTMGSTALDFAMGNPKIVPMLRKVGGKEGWDLKP